MELDSVIFVAAEIETKVEVNSAYSNSAESITQEEKQKKVEEIHNLCVSVVIIEDNYELIKDYKKILKRRLDNEKISLPEFLSFSKLSLNSRSGTVHWEEIQLLKKKRIIFLVDINLENFKGGTEDSGLVIMQRLRYEFPESIIIALTGHQIYEGKTNDSDFFFLKGRDPELHFNKITLLIKHFIENHIQEHPRSKKEFLDHLEQLYKQPKNPPLKRQSILLKTTDLRIVGKDQKINIRTQLQQFDSSKPITSSEQWYFVRKLLTTKVDTDDNWTVANCEWKVKAVKEKQVYEAHEELATKEYLSITICLNPEDDRIEYIKLKEDGRKLPLVDLDKISEALTIHNHSSFDQKLIEMAVATNLAHSFLFHKDDEATQNSVVDVASELSKEAKIELLKIILKKKYEELKDHDKAVEELMPFYIQGSFPLILNIEKGEVKDIDEENGMAKVSIGSWLNLGEIRTFRDFHAEKLMEHGVADKHDSFFYIALRNSKKDHVSDESHEMVISLADPFM